MKGIVRVANLTQAFGQIERRVEDLSFLVVCVLLHKKAVLLKIQRGQDLRRTCQVLLVAICLLVPGICIVIFRLLPVRGVGCLALARPVHAPQALELLLRTAKVKAGLLHINL